MGVKIRWGRVLWPPLVVAVIAAVAIRQPVVRWWIAGRLTPSPDAARQVEPRAPMFDGPDETRPRIAVRLEPRFIGVPQPTDVAWVPGHDRALILSKLGTAWLTRDGSPEAWLTIPVDTTSEMGLLGVAFHPRFEENGRLFLNLNRAGSRRTEVVEVHVDPGTLTRPTVTRVLLAFDQPYPNHNGGQLRFGPDGRLYVASGDGGSGNDPHGHGQSLETLLGKILRLDVDGQGPPDNPFVGVPGARAEIWATGLRNPWRFAFDPRGRMIVGDVGQGAREELDLVSAGDNLGWSVWEGDQCRVEPCASGFVPPIWTYGRDEGVSVTGGVVWTGPGPLSGRYVFGDFGSGRLWALTLPEDRAPVEEITALGRFDLLPSAFAVDREGRVVVADYGSGAIFALVPERVASPP